MNVAKNMGESSGHVINYTEINKRINVSTNIHTNNQIKKNCFQT